MKKNKVNIPTRSKKHNPYFSPLIFDNKIVEKFETFFEILVKDFEQSSLALNVILDPDSTNNIWIRILFFFCSMKDKEIVDSFA